jgi:vesicular inhibitory amino acid transporter
MTSIVLEQVAFGGHSVFPSICSSMSNKKEYPKALDVSYIIVVAVYGAIEIGGYMMYGTKTKKEVSFSFLMNSS